MKLRTEVLCFIGFAVLTLMVAWDPLSAAWKSDVATAWDAPSHEGLVALTRIHADWPPFGVYKEWFAGMPYPHFYPPLFHNFAAGISSVFGVSAYRASMVLLIGAIIVIPGLIFFLTRTWMPRRPLAAVAAGILAVHHVTDFWRAADWGLGVQAFNNIGLWSQVFTTPFWLLAALWLSGPRRSWKMVAAGIALTLTILGNPHVAISSGVMVVGLTLASRRGHILIIGSLAVVMAAWWVGPMLERQAYFPSQSLQPIAVDRLLHLFPGLFVPACLAVLLKRGGWKESVVVGALLTAFIASDPMSGLPLQPHRHVASLVLILCPLAGAGLVQVARWSLPSHPIYACGLLALPYIWFHDNGAITATVSTFDNSVAAKEILKDMNAAPGRRIIIEPLAPEMLDNQSDGETLIREDYVLRSRLAAAGHEVLTSVFRESSLLSFFAIPLRNAMAEYREHFGVVNWLVHDFAFLNQPPDRILRRAADMGVTHWLVHHPSTRARIESARNSRLVNNYGRWSLYAIEPMGVRAQMLSCHPAWILGRWNAKARDPAEFDVLRITEGLFARGGDLPLSVWPGTRVIDDALPTPARNPVVLVDYAVRDADKARDLLAAHLARGGGLIYDREQPGPLVNWLRNHRGPQVLAIRMGQPTVATARRQAIDELAQALQRLALQVTVTEIKLEHPNHRSLRLMGTKGPEQPILINYAWGPDWRRRDGANLWFAGPAMMLTYASGTTDLVFEVKGLELWCWISGIGVVLLLIFARGSRELAPGFEASAK